MINIIIITIVYIVFSIIPCNNSLSKVQYKGKIYFDHILSIFDDYSAFKLICLILCGILYGASKVLNNVTIQNFIVCHLFILIETEELSYYTMDEIDQKIGGGAFAFIIISHFFQFLLSLVFLEIIEINIYKFNENTKIHIQERAIDDMNLINEENDTGHFESISEE